jgi:hypothetical protein
METENALIRNTTIEIGHGVLTAWLHLEFDGGGVAWGGRVLEGPYAAAWFKAVLETLEAITWENIPGMYCRVRGERLSVGANSKDMQIGHIYKDKWLDADELANTLGAKR